jgi:hypothetical protein
MPNTLNNNQGIFEGIDKRGGEESETFLCSRISKYSQGRKRSCIVSPCVFQMAKNVEQSTSVAIKPINN